MGNDHVSVRRVEYADHESAVTELLEEYQRWVAEQYRRRLSRESDREGRTTPAFDPEAYVTDELTTDVEFLGDPESDGTLIVALDGNHVVGCVYLYRHSERRGEVKRLYVRAAYRGGGLGRRLMRTLVDHADEDGCSTLQLSTTPVMQYARELYHDLGFETVDAGESVSDIPIDEVTYMELSLESDPKR